MEPRFQFSEPMKRAVERYMFALNRLDNAPRDVEVNEENLLSDAFSKALDALLACPAQNIDDLRVKIDAALMDSAATPPRQWLHHIFDDLRRLSSNKRSVTFRPEGWLAWFERRGGGWVDRDGEILLLTPCNGNADDCMDELRASGGCEAVKDLIRQRGEAM